MALDNHDRPAVFSTVKEAFGLTWELRVPYLVLVCLMMVPWVAAVLLGAMEPIESFVARSAESGGAIASLGKIPFGRMLQVFLGAVAVALAFFVFWFRYLLLGPEGALRFGLGAFARIFLGFAGAALGVGLAMVGVLILAIIAVTVFSMVAAGMLGLSAETIARFSQGLGFVAGYATVFLVFARLALAFPGKALEEDYGLRASWSETAGATWPMFGALLLAALPVWALGYGITYVVFLALGVDILEPAGAAVMSQYWPVTLILGPLTHLPAALCCAVLAVAYRDLTSERRAELPAGASLA